MLFVGCFFSVVFSAAPHGRRTVSRHEVPGLAPGPGPAGRTGRSGAPFAQHGLRWSKIPKLLAPKKMDPRSIRKLKHIFFGVLDTFRWFDGTDWQNQSGLVLTCFDWYSCYLSVNKNDSQGTVQNISANSPGYLRTHRYALPRHHECRRSNTKLLSKQILQPINRNGTEFGWIWELQLDLQNNCDPKI